MILVTGATGHIGNVLVKQLLKQGEKVKVITRKKEVDPALKGLDIDYIYGDITDVGFVNESLQGATFVYHLAGLISIVPGKEKLLHKINVEGTKNIVNTCLKSNVQRLLYTSSVHAMIELPHGQTITEETEVNPEKVDGDYAKSKALATQAVLDGVDKGLNAVIVHPSGVIGPEDYKLSEMGEFILQFIQKKLRFYIEGGYDYVDVRDVASGMIGAMEKGQTGERYILGGHYITMKEMIELLEDITNLNYFRIKIPISVAKIIAPLALYLAKIQKTKPILTPYAVRTLQSNSVFSSEKAKEELDYHARPIRHTLADTVIWLRKNKLHKR